MIETYGYARAGFLGNPSDGYFGKTLAFAMSNFRARVLLYPSARLEIKPSKVDLPIFENLEDLYRITRWRGYYGGIRIIQALVVRLLDYCSVVQAYQGMVYMDFSRALMEARGYGEYERMDVGLLRNVYVAYRTSLSEGTEVFHNNLRERWLRGDPEVIGAMETWAAYAAEGRSCLLQRNYCRLNQLVDANFDLRRSIYQIDPGNLEMVQMARAAGASANFAGSGGAIVGTYEDDAMLGRLTAAGKNIGVAVIKPKIVS